MTPSKPALATRLAGFDTRAPAYWVALLLIGAAYVGAAKLGLSLSVAQGVITPVWAPTGIALAAVLLLGYRAWPAVAVAAFLVNVTSGAEPLVALALASGNTLEAVAGRYLLRRVRFSPSLARVRDVLLFVSLGAGLATTVSATIGVSALSLADSLDQSYGSSWLLWWFGDAVGALIVAPLLLVACTAGREMLPRRRVLEASALLAALVLLAVLIARMGALENRYLVFPLLLWAAIRFRQLGAASAALVLGAIGTWGAIVGEAVPTITDATERVQSIQALIAVVAVSLLVVGATLSERDRAERGARQAADLLAEAQRLAHVGSWDWVVARNELSWSEEMYRIWGVAPETFVPSQEAFRASVHPEDRERVEAAGDLAEQEGEVAYEFRILRPDGQERIIQARGTVVFDRAGQAARMIGTAQDITAARAVSAERERLLQLEREQNERLRQLDRLKDNFLASVSHELRTPLTSIIGYLELVVEEDRSQLGDAARRHVQIALRNSARLSRLIGDLLFVAQADAGQGVLERTTVAPAELIRECIESLEPWANEAQVALVFEPEEIPPLWGDPTRLAQLIENLLSNAIKFSPAGRQIEIRARAREERFVLEVSDNGIGIPAADQEHVFERFYRSGQASEQAIPGTGLGLPIARMIAEAHGGALTLTSVEGEGTTLRLELPLTQPSQVVAA